MTVVRLVRLDVREDRSSAGTDQKKEVQAMEVVSEIPVRMTRWMFCVKCRWNIVEALLALFYVNALRFR